MKLFFYYAFCSVKNQIRKLFKTWVAVLLAVCVIFGLVVGVIAASIEELIEGTDDPSIEEEIPPEELPPEDEELLPEMSQEEIYRIVEAVIGGILLVMVIFEVMGAEKNGSNIFPMADVNLLFASPMRPQSVLMFRLCCQMGAMIFLGIYLLIEVPMLITSFGFTPLSAVVAVLTFAMAVIFGKLLNVLLYTLCSTHLTLKKWLRPALYTFVALVGLGYVAVWQSDPGATPWNAAIDYFSAPWSRYIPIWGWLRAIVMLSLQEDLLGVVLCAVGLIAAMVGMALLIRHIRADFYEDALAHSSETAALLQAAQENRTTGVVRKNKKDRSDKLIRDGIRHGWGANAFFFKAMYNRFRFGHLRYFTKTAETYLVTALGVALMEKLVFQTNSFLPVALVLSAMVFFRSLGNPLPQDIGINLFLMTPESSWAKMLWSLLGGTVNCVLDLAPAMLLATVVLQVNPLAALGWLLFAVSIDVYSSTANTFIDLSVSGLLTQQLRQVVVILFIYFGLLPDVALLIVGGVLGMMPLFAALAGAFNVALGALFFALSPLFLLRGRQ